MKFVATVFGPAFRWTRTSPNAGLAWFATYVAVILTLMGLAIAHVVNGAQGWHTVQAVVIKTGQKPEVEQDLFGNNESETKSLVRLTTEGKTLEKTLILKWNLHDGSKVLLWVKGTTTRQESPTALRVVVKRPILWAVLGFIGVWVFWFLWDEVEGAVGRYDKRIEREKIEAEDATRETPTTIVAVEALCHANPDQEFEFYKGQNLKVLSRDILRLREVYFPGDKSVSLELLSHLLRSKDRNIRNTAVAMTISKLKEIGVVRSDFDWYQVDQDATAQII